MNTFARLTRSLASFLAGLATALIVFGLTLALLWALPFECTISYKLIAVLISTVPAFLVAGMVVSSLVVGNGLSHSAVFGFAFGLLSFAYLLGYEWAVLGLACVSSLLTW
jgi:hypothetical protein